MNCKLEDTILLITVPLIKNPDLYNFIIFINYKLLLKNLKNLKINQINEIIYFSYLRLIENPKPYKVYQKWASNSSKSLRIDEVAQGEPRWTKVNQGEPKVVTITGSARISILGLELATKWISMNWKLIFAQLQEKWHSFSF